MGRRYVRDKIGRFASHGGGGGSFGGGGKVGKSAKNVKARAAYKKQAVNLREAKKMSTFGKEGSRERKYWNRQLGGAKSGMTRVTNRLAGKGKGAAAAKAVGTGPKQARGVKKRRGAKVYDNTTNTSIKMKTVKKNLRRKYPESKAAKSLEKRVAAKAQSKGEKAVANRKKPERITARKREEQGLALAGRKAYRKGPGAAERKAAVTGKTWKAKPSAAKKEYKRASREDRMQGTGATKGRKKVIRKQTGKPAYQQRMGTEAGQTRLGRTKAPRAGSKTKAQKIRGKIESKKAANKALRGDEFKGVKKRTTTKKVTAKKPSYKKPKPGETAKQYKARLKRSGTLSTQRALSGNFGTRSEYYSIPGTKTGGKQTRKSINRAKNRDFYSEGSNKRSKAITKSKQRHKAKVKKIEGKFNKKRR